MEATDLGTLLVSWGLVLDSLDTVVTSLLEAEVEEVAVVSAHSLAVLLSSSEEETRDHLLIPSLCRAAARSCHSQDLLTSLLACFTVISELQLPGQSHHYHHNYHHYFFPRNSPQWVRAAGNVWDAGDSSDQIPRT